MTRPLIETNLDAMLLFLNIIIAFCWPASDYFHHSLTMKSVDHFYESLILGLCVYTLYKLVCFQMDCCKPTQPSVTENNPTNTLN